MNTPGTLELALIGLLAWALLGPQKLADAARGLGRAYRQFVSARRFDFPLGAPRSPSEAQRLRAAAERLGIDTAGMDRRAIKRAVLEKLSK